MTSEPRSSAGRRETSISSYRRRCGRAARRARLFSIRQRTIPRFPSSSYSGAWKLSRTKGRNRSATKRSTLGVEDADQPERHAGQKAPVGAREALEVDRRPRLLHLGVRERQLGRLHRAHRAVGNTVECSGSAITALARTGGRLRRQRSQASAAATTAAAEDVASRRFNARRSARPRRRRPPRAHPRRGGRRRARRLPPSR